MTEEYLRALAARDEDQRTKFKAAEADAANIARAIVLPEGTIPAILQPDAQGQKIDKLLLEIAHIMTLSDRWAFTFDVDSSAVQAAVP